MTHPYDLRREPPAHYKHGIEPIDVIQSWKLNFALGNVIKYIGRADHKGNRREDLKKALDYLIMELEDMNMEEPK